MTQKNILLLNRIYMQNIEQRIRHLLTEYNKPKRRALSLVFPFLKAPIIFGKRLVLNFKNLANNKLAKHKQEKLLAYVMARHQSVLLRRLGKVDQRLQKQKITNLKIAVRKLDKLVIKHGETFSFWYLVGLPTKRKGYVGGLLLSNGRTMEGIGGGLCQLSNLLYWLFLHSPVKVVERHHHSYDVFPDSGRVLPFGSGATVFYNYVDLRIKNISDASLQLNLWLTDELLKGQILSDKKNEFKYSVVEKDHCFIGHQDRYFRYNKIYRNVLNGGVLVAEEEIMENFSPVLYDIDRKEMETRGYKFLDI